MLFYPAVVGDSRELPLSSCEMQWQRNSLVDAKRNKVSSVSAVFPGKLITVQSCAVDTIHTISCRAGTQMFPTYGFASYATPWSRIKAARVLSIVYRTGKWHTYINWGTPRKCCRLFSTFAFSILGAASFPTNGYFCNMFANKQNDGNPSEPFVRAVLLCRWNTVYPFQYQPVNEIPWDRCGSLNFSTLARRIPLRDDFRGEPCRVGSHHPRVLRWISVG